MLSRGKDAVLPNVILCVCLCARARMHVCCSAGRLEGHFHVLLFFLDSSHATSGLQSLRGLQSLSLQRPLCAGERTQVRPGLFQRLLGVPIISTSMLLKSITLGIF